MKKLCSSLAFVFLMMGGMFFYFELSSYLIYSKEPVDIIADDMRDLKSWMHVKSTINAVWDGVVVETTTHTTMGIKTSSDESRYYAVPYLYCWDVDGERYETAFADYFILVKVNKSQFNKFDQMVEETIKWEQAWWAAYDADEDLPEMPDFNFVLEGTPKKLKKEQKEIMREYLEELQYEFDSDHPTLDSYYTPYYIEMGSISDYDPLIMRICLGIIGLGVLFLLLYLRIIKKEKKRQKALVATYQQRQSPLGGNTYNAYANAYGTNRPNTNNNAYNPNNGYNNAGNAYNPNNGYNNAGNAYNPNNGYNNVGNAYNANNSYNNAGNAYNANNESGDRFYTSSGNSSQTDSNTVFNNGNTSGSGFYSSENRGSFYTSSANTNNTFNNTYNMSEADNGSNTGNTSGSAPGFIGFNNDIPNDSEPL